MNHNPHEIEAVEHVESNLVDDSSQFFAPVASDLLSQLLGQYQSMRARVEAIAEMVTGETAGAMSYFIDGNQDQHSRYAPSVEMMFRLTGAVAALNAAYWSKTLALTDVLDMMPQKRRDEWHKTIREMTAPDFTEEAVRPTITELLNMRAQFLSERVDGIFRGLSGDHVTNAPEGFGKRMIFAGLTSYSSYSTKGVLNDLRCVVAKFMGRDEPTYNATDRLVDALKGNWGQWITIDGGALRIRLYMKGTAHLEVHPDMAWRLNSVLASLYPRAIPAQFRQKPKKQAKTFALMQRPLPFAVLEILSDARPGRQQGFDAKTVTLSAYSRPKNAHAWDEAGRILEAIGGSQVYHGCYEFDYSPGSVMDEIITSGCIPDKASHQYYPTPESLARRVLELANVGDADTVLEPSAGQGGLADLLPKERTTCVEISALNCKVLRAKGHNAIQADFIEWVEKSNTANFDRVVMNPPFSDGRWQAHITAAAVVVAPGGRLVAIVPASAKGKDVLPAYMGAITWHGPFDNEFSGTSVSVAVLVANRG